MPSSPRATGGDHSGVRRADAEPLLRLMLIAFATSVLGTRLYLYATGYPQIGGGRLHIAHALWGGLMLFAAATVALTLANRWALTVAAVLTGAGAGLFIDEVGKFITADNDYFFPAAAPIAYAVFLLSVLVYLRARRDAENARASLYHALERCQGVLDGDLSDREMAHLEAALSRVAGETQRRELRQLAVVLRDYLHAVPPTPAAASRSQRARRRLEQWASRWFTERRTRWVLIAGLAVLGVSSLSDFSLITTVAVTDIESETSPLPMAVAELAQTETAEPEGRTLLVTRALLDVAIGLMFLVAAWLLLRRRLHVALDLARYTLLLTLAVVNLLIFYFEQFYAAVGATAELALLLTVGYYQRRYGWAAGPASDAGRTP